MPRKPGKVPSYCLHKASNRAVVRIDGRDYYLGVYGSPESHEMYERLVAEWRAKNRQRTEVRQAVVANQHFDLTISQVMLRYQEFAKGYYVKNGKPTKELAEMGFALKPVRQLYGKTLARDFGPLALSAVQQHLVDRGLSRGVINHRINRVKRFFKWATSKQLVPPAVHEGVRTVVALKFGRTEARETDPVRPVPDRWVDAVLPVMCPQVAALVRLQRWTGMRPCEVVALRACDIDMSGDVWIYEPFEHKNQWRGHRRLIPLGPKAQKTIKPFLTLKTDAFLFSPADAERWRNELRRKNRKTPMTPSQAARERKTDAKRAKRNRYDTDSYRRAITYAIKKANRKRDKDAQIPHWYPLQLRHSRATEVRKGFGVEAAQVSLGHAHADITEVYAERNLDLAISIAKQTG